MQSNKAAPLALHPAAFLDEVTNSFHDCAPAAGREPTTTFETRRAAREWPSHTRRVRSI